MKAAFFKVSRTTSNSRKTCSKETCILRTLTLGVTDSYVQTTVFFMFFLVFNGSRMLCQYMRQIRAIQACLCFSEKCIYHKGHHRLRIQIWLRTDPS